MPFPTAIVLFVAGMMGGALNAVAGGGSFVAFPALLFTGVPPIPANATNTFALFMTVLPWLMLGATLLFAFGKRLSRGRGSGLAHDASTAALVGASIFELFVAVYGGYFGGGVGIMNLAMLAALGMTDIHSMNALKILLGAVINGVALVTFIAKGAIVWPQAILMTVGATLGGYCAAHFSQKLPQSWVRAFVLLVGSGMTVYFFVRGYIR